MKYTFIAAHQEEYTIQGMCRALGVGRSGYYAWSTRPLSQRAQANQALVEQIQAEHQAS
jgi:putative transposase